VRLFSSQKTSIRASGKNVSKIPPFYSGRQKITFRDYKKANQEIILTAPKKRPVSFIGKRALIFVFAFQVKNPFPSVWGQ
jgi:hypothetical protein